MNPVDRNLKKIEFLRCLHCMFSMFCARKKVEGKFEAKFWIREHNTRSKYDLHSQFCNTTFFSGKRVKHEC